MKRFLLVLLTASGKLHYTLVCVQAFAMALSALIVWKLVPGQRGASLAMILCLLTLAWVIVHFVIPAVREAHRLYHEKH